MMLTPESGGNRVRIEYSPPANFSHCASFQVSHDGGVTWRAVPALTHVPVPENGLLCAYDYMAPLDVLTLYRALPYRQEGDRLFPAPCYSEWASTTLESDGWWLQ